MGSGRSRAQRRIISGAQTGGLPAAAGWRKDIGTARYPGLPPGLRFYRFPASYPYGFCLRFFAFALFWSVVVVVPVRYASFVICVVGAVALRAHVPFSSVVDSAPFACLSGSNFVLP